MDRARIVLADDHADFRICAAGFLEPEFELVASVGDGQALIRAAEENDPHLLLVDISMPVCDGFEAVRRLKSAGSCAKVVFVSVHQDQDFVRTALDLGADGYVLKSRLASDLIPALREALAGRKFVSASR
jgi:DNA-binding NarL/FixJ family response regulator